MKRIYLTVDDHLTEINTLEKGCWVHLQNPTREEIDGLNARFHLEPTYLQAALDEEESARIERDGDQVLIIVDIPYIDNEETGVAYTTIPLGIIMVDDVIITVSTRESTVITDFTEERIRGFWTFKRTRFLLQILQRTASRYLNYLKQIDKASLFVQKHLEKDMRNQELLQMMKLEKSLVFFSTSLKGNEMVMERMLRMEMLRKYPDDSELLEDVIIENKQAMEMCSIYRNIISSTMDAFASIISNNLNIVMKILTSLTVVLSIPTLFASLWGMNVPVPFQQNPYGFWIVIAITVVASLAAFLVLWRKKMF
ncbi:MAG: magnesium transporter CorA family protein [Clostridia bacterium]|nr:magnesium transporter CorA family protein [Clostridia bacterium]MDD6040109.1 magnesium transporter CorA family protein [Clostridia bacterium]